MDNNLLELFMKMFNNQSPQPSQSPNPFYPQEAFTQSAQSQTENNMLPLLLSLMGKGGGGMGSIMEALSKKPEKNDNSSDGTIPDDEILL